MEHPFSVLSDLTAAKGRYLGTCLDENDSPTLRSSVAEVREAVLQPLWWVCSQWALIPGSIDASQGSSCLRISTSALLSFVLFPPPSAPLHSSLFFLLGMYENSGMASIATAYLKFLIPPLTTEILLLEGSRVLAMGVLSGIMAPSTGKCCEVSAPFLAVLLDPLVDSLGNVCRGLPSEHPCVHSVSIFPVWE